MSVMNGLASAPDVPTVDSIIGRNIDFLIWRSRERKAAAAAGLGMSPQSLSQKLAGQRPWSAAEIQRAAARFRVSIDTLFTQLPDLDSNQEPIGSPLHEIIHLDELRQKKAAVHTSKDGNGQVG